MRHVDDITAMNLAEGAEPGSAAEHCARCEQCRTLVEDYRTLLAAVTEATEHGTPPPSLMRWASAYAGTRPVERIGSSLLALLGGGAALVPAVRGGTPEIALLYGDDTHHLDLRVDPDDADRSRLHGHLVHLAGGPAHGFGISLVTADGSTRQTRTDAAGEFWLDDVPGWEHASLVATSDEQRLVVARLGRPREASTRS
jgi:hypothetical protein